MATAYTFPKSRLRTILTDRHREPLVLVACGSFSPITNLHLRMFELAGDYVRHATSFELVGGYFSPVSDAYKKDGLAPAKHRLNMVRLACQETSDRWDVDSWEASQATYTPTALVLDHFDAEINGRLGGVAIPESSEKRKAKIMLLAGSDLLKTMSDEGVWNAKDLNHILGHYGAVVIERMGSDIKKATSALSHWADNIHQVEQTVMNDVSSTKVRLLLRKEYSVRYLLPESVVDYIEEHGLYSREMEAARRASHSDDRAQTPPLQDDVEPDKPNWERLLSRISM
ncbi:Nicotinamide/nicotinic acid mononucleotide adenylyltransferase 1 [Savitreella phatthalungensis]